MGSRIRTIKPELPHSQHVGKLSHEARLCWLLLFTMADDWGRFRAHPAEVACQCYPYDHLPDALVDCWLWELVDHGFIARYDFEGEQYGAIANWDRHQKIANPAKSRLPAREEGTPTERVDVALGGSRKSSEEILEPPRIAEKLPPDLGPRTVDQDHGPEPVAKADALPTTVVVPQAVQLAEAGARCTQGVEGLWGLYLERHPRTVLTDDRRKLGLKFLRSHGYETCEAAIRGIVFSPHHMGDNDRATRYDGWEHIFKSAKNVEQFAGYWLDPSTRPKGRALGPVERQAMGREFDLDSLQEVWAT